jgi:PTS system nitrogen regulatory IIA component
MRLTPRNVGEMLKVSEATVVQWVKRRGLPGQHVGGWFRFNWSEVFDWALAHQVKVENTAKENALHHPHQVSLADALEAGGVHHRVPGRRLEATLRAVVSRLLLPRSFDRQSLLELFMARESIGCVSVGDGIAIPLVRYPIVLRVPECLATLCFLKHPVGFEAGDGKPARILFCVVSPTVSAHSRLVERLSLALHDGGFRRSVVQVQSRDCILREARRVEMAEHVPEGIRPRAA